jgi:outer membrane murein-binding lipoprotein Lpp
MQSFRDLLSMRQAWISVLCALALAGCAHHGDIDALESELRQQEQAQEDLSQQLARAREDLKVAESDRAVLRSQLNKHHQVSLSQEQADVLYRAEAIKFNMLMTSGQNRDSEPGDEGLSVMLTPVDAHGDLVKLAGEVELDLFDMTLESDEQRLGQWKFTIDEVRSKWQSGFISSGYLFQVDWQKFPVARELTLHARLSIPDGRRFDVTSQVKVEPPTAASRPVARTGKPPRRVGPSSPVYSNPAATGVTPASATVKARRPNSAAAFDASKVSPTPRIRPTPPTTPSNAPTRTSDKWTETTIPTVR